MSKYQGSEQHAMLSLLPVTPTSLSAVVAHYEGDEQDGEEDEDEDKDKEDEGEGKGAGAADEAAAAAAADALADEADAAAEAADAAAEAADAAADAAAAAAEAAAEDGDSDAVRAALEAADAAAELADAAAAASKATDAAAITAATAAGASPSMELGLLSEGSESPPIATHQSGFNLGCGGDEGGVTALLSGISGYPSYTFATPTHAQSTQEERYGGGHQLFYQPQLDRTAHTKTTR